MKEQATERLELRIEPDQKATLVYAADLMDVKVADLVRSGALELAERVVRERATTVVPTSYFRELLDALGGPGTVNEPLRRATDRAAKTVDRR
jgi:uncharacterized protein (DUF1778 family)